MDKKIAVKADVLLDECIREHFEYTCSKVTKRDIVDFSPGDPGYGNYVQLWTRILESRVIPTRTEFDLSEVIGLTGWVDAYKEHDPSRFRFYRRFTSAVGIALLHYGNCSDCVRPPNYIARDLLVDLDPFEPLYLEMLKRVFRSTREVLKKAGNEEEYPYFTLGLMILEQIDGNFDGAEKMAIQLIKDDHTVRNDERVALYACSPTVVLGLSNYDQVQQDWVRLVGELQNPTNQMETQLIIDDILTHVI